MISFKNKKYEDEIKRLSNCVENQKAIISLNEKLRCQNREEYLNKISILHLKIHQDVSFLHSSRPFLFNKRAMNKVLEFVDICFKEFGYGEEA